MMRIIRMRLNSVIVRFILVMLLMFVFPFTAVLLLTTNRLSTMEKESANQYLSSNLHTVSVTVDQALRNLEFSHTSIFMDRGFLSAIKRLSPYDERQEYSDYLETNAIKSCIGRIAATNDYIDSIYAYSMSAERMFSSKTNWNPAFNHFPSAKWLDDSANASRANPWVITQDLLTGHSILSSYREVWTYGHDAPVGLVSINVDNTFIEEMMSRIAPGSSGYSFMIDAHEQLIGYNDYEDPIFLEMRKNLPNETREGYFDFRCNDKNMFVSYYTSAYSGFRYVIAMPIDGMQTSVSVMQQLIVLFLLLLLLLGILAVILVRHYFLSPTRALFAGMANVEEGDFSVRLPFNPTREFGYINKSFNRMIDSIDNLISENYTNRLVNKEAQLKNIQNQLNEHFLYNTLDSIHWLARIEDAPRVSEMVFALAHFYRHSLSAGRDAIPAEEVIEMLRNYLFIQKFRLRDAMNYTLGCDPALSCQLMPKNTLQPLVENAIIHGLKDLDREGLIRVAVSEHDGQMRFEVYDNGNGFTPEQLAKVQGQLSMKGTYCEHSFALKTMQSQLQIYYACPIELHIDTALGQGTTVWFDVPLGKGGTDRCEK